MIKYVYKLLDPSNRPYVTETRDMYQLRRTVTIMYISTNCIN